jgi:flavin reductase (DIM6/NTAB) family NADH-FMN oxidoreductase RutF
MKTEVPGVKGIFCFPSFPLAVACIKENPITLAAVGFFSFKPPIVGIGIMENRHSYRLIRETMDFTLNLPSVEQLDAAHYIGTVSGRDADKLREAGLTPIKGTHVSSSWIKEFPVSMECRVIETIDLGGSHVWFLGEVLTAYVEETYDRSQAISYWGDQYRRTGEELAVMKIEGEGKDARITGLTKPGK